MSGTTSIANYNPITHRLVSRNYITFDLSKEELKQLVFSARVRKGIHWSEFNMFDTSAEYGLFDVPLRIVNELEQLQKQLSPPRIEEPKEFGAIVEADFILSNNKPQGRRTRWVRATQSFHNEEGYMSYFADLIDPKLVSK